MGKGCYVNVKKNILVPTYLASPLIKLSTTFNFMKESDSSKFAGRLLGHFLTNWTRGRTIKVSAFVLGKINLVWLKFEMNYGPMALKRK